MKPRLFALSSPSFALISVLALVSLAALTATAFLASARLDRQATLSLGETARLEMACTSARECASQTLNLIFEPQWRTIATYWRGTNDTDWTNELGYLLLGKPNSSANVRWTYFCGFNTALHKKLDTNVFVIAGTNTNPGSYLTEIGSFMATMTNGFVTNPAFTDTNCTLIPMLGGRTSPPVGWTYIYQDKKIANSMNTTNVPVARFSYYMEDLSGLIDAERMGGGNRTIGTNASEISLTNLTTNWSSSSILNASNYTQFINPTNRAKYLSPGLILYANNSLNTNDLRYFAHGLLSWSNFPDTIPVGIPITSSTGYGKGDNNTRKVNLNSAGNLNVTTIADAIRDNLPRFANRAGAMNGGDYLSNIAANIVDYVDTDTNPTIDSSAGIPNWRGVESIAWPNEVFTRFNLADRSTNPPNYKFQLGVKQYIEVWNLSSTSVVVDGADYSISNNLDIPLKCTNWNGNLKSADPATPPANETCTNPSFTLPPNSYGVISASTRTFNILVPTSLAPGTNPALTINPSTTANKYTISYKGKIVDATPGGRWLGNATNMKVGEFHFITTAVNFGSSANGSLYNLAAGDPRGGLFVQQPSMDFSYNYTTPGGRNSRLSANGGARIVDPKVNWVDGGHSLGDSGADIVTPPTSANANNSIAQGPQKQGNPNHWVQKVNNTGSFTNIFELGNIFDPIQWGDPKNPFNPLDTAAWMGLSNSATASSAACGRNTLRVGRPEHQRFAFTNLGGAYPVPNMGLSAAALLDIFSTSDKYDNGGKINLNTAPAPVLRALAGGITLSNDLAMTPSATLAIPQKMTEAFAQGVMRYRSMYPFLSPSQLAFIATDYGVTNGANHWTNTWPKNAVFGNTNPAILLNNAPGNTLGTTASMGVTAWNDQAAEEWFSKIYGLSAVQSWNYRIYVVAQLVNTNGLPTGPTMRKYSLIYGRYNNSDTSPNPPGPPSTGPFMSFESPY